MIDILYVLPYLIIGLVVAKLFQRWLNRTACIPTELVDMPSFVFFIIVWPVCVIVRLIFWLIQLWIWFFHLRENKK